MIFATLREGGPDGTLLVVDRDRSRAVRASETARTLQSALDDWDNAAPRLQELSDALNARTIAGDFQLNVGDLMAPLPRAFAYFDAGSYPHHIIPIRQVRGASLPADFYEHPLMYEGCSSPILSSTEPLDLAQDEEWEVDVEAEIAVITGAVPVGVSRPDAARHIRLITLYNDTSLRRLVAPELGRGFGFLQSKPPSSMAPFAITPDEAGSLWKGDLLGGRYVVEIRGKRIGDLDPAKDHIYTFSDLIVHLTKTRPLTAGSLIASGTIANEDRRHGCGCIAELRAREQLASGAPATPYLRYGDRFRLELLDSDGVSLFGAIDQRLASGTALASMSPEDQARSGN